MTNGNDNGREATAWATNQPFYRRTVLAGTGAAIVGATGSATAKGSRGWTPQHQPEHSNTRLNETYRLRQTAAREQLLEPSGQITYDAEPRLEGAINRFTKCFPHDDNGDSDLTAYDTFLAALFGEAEYDEIALAADADRVLENPTAANSATLQGSDPLQLPLPPNPAFDSAATAAKVVDVDPRRGMLELDEEFFVDFGELPEGPGRAHEIRWPDGDCTSDVWL